MPILLRVEYNPLISVHEVCCLENMWKDKIYESCIQKAEVLSPLFPIEIVSIIKEKMRNEYTTKCVYRKHGNGVYDLEC